MRFSLLLLLLISLSSKSESIDYQSFDEHHFDHLRLIAKENSEQGRLAKAVVSSMLGRNEEAEVALLQLSESQDKEIAARALRSLSGVYVRQGQFHDAATVFRSIRDYSSETSVAVDDGTIAFFQALSLAPAMTVTGVPVGKVDLNRDGAGLPRITVSVNGKEQIAVFDTGAAISTVTVSTANHLGLVQLGARVNVQGSTGASVQAGLALAEELAIDQFVFRNVPFVVVEDETLAFPQHDYEIAAIVGLPLISRLGRLSFSKVGSDNFLFFEPAKQQTDTLTTNVITSGWELVVLGFIGDSDDRQWFFLDSGAAKSVLFERATALVQTAEHGKKSSISKGGVGGSIDSEVVTVPGLTLRIGSTVVHHGPISITPDDGSFRYGVIGSDVLFGVKEAVLDFGSMKLELNQ